MFWPNPFFIQVNHTTMHSGDGLFYYFAYFQMNNLFLFCYSLYMNLAIAGHHL